MIHIFCFIILNFILGISLYFLLPLDKADLSIGLVESLGNAAVYSIIFCPVISYLLRWVGLDNGVTLLFIILFLVCLVVVKIRVKKIKLIIRSDSENYWILLLGVMFFGIIWCVNEGFLLSNTYWNCIFDYKKSCGMLLSAISSNGMVIEHPFAHTMNATYYMFYYYFLAEPFKLLGNHCNYNTFPLIFMVSILWITIAILFMFSRIAKQLNCNEKLRNLVCVIFLLDGGGDAIYYLTSGNRIPEINGGCIDDWVRTVFINLSPIAHSNYMLKVIWQQQHVSAIIPFLLIIYLMQVLTHNKEKSNNIKYHMLMAISLVSVFGYSVLVAFSVFIIVFFWIIWYLLKNRDLRNFLPYILAVIISLPLLLTYTNNSQSASISIYSINRWIEYFEIAPVWAVLNIIIEYGSILLLAIIAIFIIVKKRYREKYLYIYMAGVETVLLLTLYMSGVNDLGMVMSFVLLIIFCIISMSEDTLKIIEKAPVFILLICLLGVGIITNVKGLAFHNSLNRETTLSKELDIMELANWMCDNTVYSDGAIFVDDEEGQWLNSFIPVLFHTMTFYPLSEGIQYMNKEDSDKTNEFWNKYSEWDTNDKVNEFIKYDISYYILRKDSANNVIFENSKIVHSNNLYNVYYLER